MFMTDQIKNGLIEALKYVLTEKGVLAVVTLGTWLAVLVMFFTQTPDVISTWRTAQEETTKGFTTFLELQTRQTTILEEIQRSSELRRAWEERIEQRMERIEEQTRLRQSSTITPRTLPASDHQTLPLPMERDYYDRAADRFRN